jgi:hypothetical protein
MKKCAHAGCGGSAFVRGVCGFHALQMYYGGLATEGRRPRPEGGAGGGASAARRMASGKGLRREYAHDKILGLSPLSLSDLRGLPT